MKKKAEIIQLVGLFTLVWFSTFSAAYVNGDDVVHVSGSQVWDIFYPGLKESWIPNRVVDLYGRSLMTAVFDFLYFPFKALFGWDFFNAYKAYSATVFATFLTLVYAYISNFVARLQFTEAGHSDGRTYGWIVNILLAVILVTCFPWQNQVHLLAYQVPAFITFVLLSELTKAACESYMRSGPATADPARSASKAETPVILLLSFVVAFSLEAYAAITWFSVLAAWGLLAFYSWRKGAGRNDTRGERLTVSTRLFGYGSIGAFVFCSAALLITMLYSGRAELADDNDFLANLSKLDASHIAQGELFGFFGSHGWQLFFLALISSLIVISVNFVFRRTGRGGGERPHFSIREWFGYTKIFILSAVIVCFLSFVVTWAISAKAGTNYFLHAFYPWGAFLLVAKLSLLVLAMLFLQWTLYVSSGWKNVFALLMFVVISKYAFMYFNGAHGNYAESRLVEKAYAVAIARELNAFDTSLKLEEIPMQIRPLPTEGDPDWFFDSYRLLFRKYYEVDELPAFR